MKEMARKQEEAEKVRKERAGRREAAVAVGIVRRSEESRTRPVTIDGENGDLIIRDQDTTPQSAGLEASQYPTTEGTDITPWLICILQHNCNDFHPICVAPFERAKKFSADIVCLKELH